MTMRRGRPLGISTQRAILVVDRRRIALGLSLDTLAELCGVNGESVRRWLCGIEYPRLDHRSALAEALVWSIDHLEDELLAVPVEPCGEHGAEWAPRAAAAGAPAATD